MTDPRRDAARVELYRLALGVGDTSSCVRANGRIFEAVVAHRQRRLAAGLYHSALMVRLDGACYAIEMAPAWGHREQDRGVVAEGPVGLPWLGRSRFFRYEIRRWRDGVIPDIAEAVGSPRSVDTDVGRAGRLLDLVPAFPAVTWGRDELRAGEMWNSNSLISWLLVRSGRQAGPIRPPARRRPCSRMVGRPDRGGQGYAGTISYSSMRNHDLSAAAISFRQVMTPGSEASQVKRSRGPVCPARWPSWSSPSPARSSSPRRSPWSPACRRRHAAGSW